MYAALLRWVTRPWFYYTARTAYFLVARLLWGIRAEGKENVPREGGLVLAANHFSTYDPPTIGSLLPREVSFMAKKELFENRFLNLIFRGVHAFPVDRGRSDVSAIKEALRRLKADDAVGVFIQGTRNQGDVEALDGAAFLAQRANVPILPAAIWREGRRFEVRFGEPFEVAGKGRAAMYAATATTVHRINDLLPTSTVLLPPERGAPADLPGDRAAAEGASVASEADASAEGSADGFAGASSDATGPRDPG